MDQKLSRSTLLNLPNLLTIGRIVAVPILVACFFLGGDMGRIAAFVVFVAAAITDYLDGMLARAWGLQSDLGKMLDPIADKMIVAASLIMLAADQTISGLHLFAAVLIIGREIMVSGLREYLGQFAVKVSVSHLAKWKTTIQLIAVALLLLGPTGDNYFPLTTDLGLILLWVSVLLTLYTGYDYFRAGLSYLDGREQ